MGNQLGRENIAEGDFFPVTYLGSSYVETRTNLDAAMEALAAVLSRTPVHRRMVVYVSGHGMSLIAAETEKEVARYPFARIALCTQLPNSPQMPLYNNLLAIIALDSLSGANNCHIFQAQSPFEVVQSFDMYLHSAISQVGGGPGAAAAAAAAANAGRRFRLQDDDTSFLDDDDDDDDDDNLYRPAAHSHHGERHAHFADEDPSGILRRGYGTPSAATNAERFAQPRVLYVDAERDAAYREFHTYNFTGDDVFMTGVVEVVDALKIDTIQDELERDFEIMKIKAHYFSRYFADVDLNEYYQWRVGRDANGYPLGKGPDRPSRENSTVASVARADTIHSTGGGGAPPPPPPSGPDDGGAPAPPPPPPPGGGPDVPGPPPPPPPGMMGGMMGAGGAGGFAAMIAGAKLKKSAGEGGGGSGSGAGAGAGSDSQKGLGGASMMEEVLRRREEMRKKGAGLISDKASLEKGGNRTPAEDPLLAARARLKNRTGGVSTGANTNLDADAPPPPPPPGGSSSARNNNHSDDFAPPPPPPGLFAAAAFSKTSKSTSATSTTNASSSFSPPPPPPPSALASDAPPPPPLAAATSVAAAKAKSPPAGAVNVMASRDPVVVQRSDSMKAVPPSSATVDSPPPPPPAATGRAPPISRSGSIADQLRPKGGAGVQRSNTMKPGVDVDWRPDMSEFDVVFLGATEISRVDRTTCNLARDKVLTATIQAKPMLVVFQDKGISVTDKSKSRTFVQVDLALIGYSAILTRFNENMGCFCVVAQDVGDRNPLCLLFKTEDPEWVMQTFFKKSREFKTRMKIDLGKKEDRTRKMGKQPKTQQMHVAEDGSLERGPSSAQDKAPAAKLAQNARSSTREREERFPSPAAALSGVTEEAEPASPAPVRAPPSITTSPPLPDPSASSPANVSPPSTRVNIVKSATVDSVTPPDELPSQAALDRMQEERDMAANLAAAAAIDAALAGQESSTSLAKANGKGDSPFGMPPAIAEETEPEAKTPDVTSSLAPPPATSMFSNDPTFEDNRSIGSTGSPKVKRKEEKERAKREAREAKEREKEAKEREKEALKAKKDADRKRKKHAPKSPAASIRSTVSSNGGGGGGGGFMKPPSATRAWGDDSDEEDQVMANVHETKRLQAEMLREKSVLKGYISLMKMAKKGSKERYNAEQLVAASEAKIERLKRDLTQVSSGW